MNPSKPKRRVGLWIAVAVAALLVAVVAIALKVYFEYDSLLETGSAGNLPTSYEPLAGAESDPLADVEEKDVYNLLLAVIDNGVTEEERSYGEGLGNTDLLMYIRLDHKNNKLSILQIPRDTYVGPELAEQYTAKINGAFLHGPEEENRIANTANVVYQLFGLKADNYVVMDLNAFRTMVDTMGGIWMHIPRDLVDKKGNVVFQEGDVKVDGQSAELILRNRNTARSDYDRLELQQSFYAAVFKTFMNDYPIGDAMKVAKMVAHYVNTDLSLMDLAGLYLSLKDLTAADVYMVRCAGGPITVDGNGSLYGIEKEYTANILNEHFLPAGAAQLFLHLLQRRLHRLQLLGPQAAVPAKDEHLAPRQPFLQVLPLLPRPCEGVRLHRGGLQHQLAGGLHPYLPRGILHRQFVQGAKVQRVVAVAPIAVVHLPPALGQAAAGRGQAIRPGRQPAGVQQPGGQCAALLPPPAFGLGGIGTPGRLTRSGPGFIGGVPRRFHRPAAGQGLGPVVPGRFHLPVLQPAGGGIKPHLQGGVRLGADRLIGRAGLPAGHRCGVIDQFPAALGASAGVQAQAHGPAQRLIPAHLGLARGGGAAVGGYSPAGQADRNQPLIVRQSAGGGLGASQAGRHHLAFHRGLHPQGAAAAGQQGQRQGGGGRSKPSVFHGKFPLLVWYLYSTRRGSPDHHRLVARL